MNGRKQITLFLLLCVALAGATSPILGQEAAAAGSTPEAPAVSQEMFAVNNVWMMVSTFLVFIMHLGFATLESGLARAKNTVNILFKNTFIVAIGILTYAAVGFNLMYPGFEAIKDAAGAVTGWKGGWNGVIGFSGFGIGTDAAGTTIAYAGGKYTYWTDFLFQGMFAATAATIISGAVAERVKLWPFLIVTTIYVAVIYPVIGSWKWGLGWLDANGFYDFAGSTLVHSVGGWGALAAVLLLGPRLNKYLPSGAIKPMYAHNMPLATIGVFLLWLGWFGFNGGSVLSADPGVVSYVLVTTSLAAAAGIVGAGITSSLWMKKPDLSMALNGCLAGLVGITAGADSIGIMNAVLVGLIAGVVVVFAVISLDKLKLDDPVGAISVHLVCGIWGTLAVGIFSKNEAHTIGAQLLGIASAGALAFSAAFLLFFLAKITLGIRVPRDEELKGLDIGEHGVEAYGGFQVVSVD